MGPDNTTHVSMSDPLPTSAWTTGEPEIRQMAPNAVQPPSSTARLREPALLARAAVVTEPGCEAGEVLLVGVEHLPAAGPGRAGKSAVSFSPQERESFLEPSPRKRWLPPGSLP